MTEPIAIIIPKSWTVTPIGGGLYRIDGPERSGIADAGSLQQLVTDLLNGEAK